MEIIYKILIFINENKYWITLFILYTICIFMLCLLPKIEKKLKEKNELINEKDETISGARVHYKDLLIEVKTLRLENEALKQRISELEEYEKKIKQMEFEQNRKERYKKYLETASNKGKEYEEFVAGYYKLDGYEVNLHGIKKGKKDKGIDIICTKDEELILIQCKNWKEDSKYKINHEKLKAFVGCCTEYVNENKLFDKNIKLKFITSNYILDESGKKFLQESKTLQYEILKY
jgi:regulator of replication initiation timing